MKTQFASSRTAEHSTSVTHLPSGTRLTAAPSQVPSGSHHISEIDASCAIIGSPLAEHL